MTAGKSNLPASVAARLLNRAKQTGDVYQTLLTSFCFERFLYRLGKSEARERFVLKGAMLLRVWSEQPYRATRDLDLLRKGDTIRTLVPIIRGWTAYYRLSRVTNVFEELDQWLRRKLRVVLWRQWKRNRTRFDELCRRGLAAEHARLGAGNGRGPWWNAGASHMNAAVPGSALRSLGLVSFVEEHRRLTRST
jgi:RNA-directed DNA polymerase